MMPAVRSTLELVAIAFETVSVDDILGHRKFKTFAEARHVAMWLLRHKFGMSYPEVGHALSRDHTSAMHGIARVENDMRLRALAQSLMFDRVPLIDLPAVAAE